MLRRLLLILGFSSAAMCPFAAGFDQIVTLGDSLLDDVDGSRSPVAAEHLAGRLEVPITKFAEFGATSGDLIADGQHTRAASTGGAGNLAVLWIGGNDFFSNAAASALGEFGFLVDLENNVDTAISAVRAAGIDVVALNLPDFAKIPVIQETVRSVLPSDFLRQAALNNFTNATRDWNSRLDALAAKHGAAVVDVFEVVDRLWQDPSDFAILGYEPVLSHDWGCQYCVFADVAHPSSYAQGYIANELMAVVDEYFGAPGDAALQPLSSVEIALLAHLLAGDFDENGMVDGDDLVVWAQGFQYFEGEALHADGDADGDGRVDGGDFLWWQRQRGDALIASPHTAIPEPSALVLFLVVGGVFIAWQAH